MLIVQIDCADHQDRMRLNSQEQPIICQQSHSELKQPTVNSSFLFGSPSPQSPNFEDHNRSSSIQRQDFLNKGNETETRGIRQKSEIQRQKKSEFLTGQLDVINYQKRLVQKFIAQLMQQAYIYKENLFNSFQKELLIEKYLLDSEQKEINNSNILIQGIWDVSYSIVSIAALIWLPLQIGFQLKNQYTINGIIITIIIIDILMTVSNKIFQRKNLNQTTLDFMQFISCIMIFCENLDSLIQLLIFAIQLLSITNKLKGKINDLQNYLSFDPSFYLFISQLLLLIHICACLWHFIGLQERESWIALMQIEDTDNFTKYCYSIYWSTSSLLNIGQGNIKIITNIELLFSSVIMFLSSWILMNIFLNLQGQEEEPKIKQNFRIQLATLNDFFKNKRIPLSTKAKIRSQIREVFKKKGGSKVKYENILSELSLPLKDELLFDMRIHAIKKCKVLERFSLKCKQSLPKLMDFISYEPNQTLNEKQLYIIESGLVEVKEHEKTVQRLYQGDTFGQFNFFTSTNDVTQYITKEETTVFQIRQDEFIKLIKENQYDYELFQFMSHSLMNNNFSMINICCLSCGSNKHILKDCHIIHYKPNIRRLLQEAKLFKQQRTYIVRDRQINHRLNNQVFTRLDINVDALNLLKIKLGIYTPEGTSEIDQSEGEFIETNFNSSSDPVLSNISFNRTKEYNKEGTTISMFKDQVLEPQKQTQVPEEWNDEYLLIKSQQFQGLLNQGIIQSELEQSQQLPSKQQVQYNLSQIRNPQSDLNKRNSQIQQDQHSQSNTKSEEPFHSQSRIKQKNGSQSKIQSQTLIDKGIKNNLYEIREEDPNSLILAKKISEDALSAQFTKQQVKLSTHPKRNTMVRSTNKSSRLSSTQLLNSGTITNCRSLINPLLTTNHFSLPFENGVVDLSMYKNFDQEDDFEVMYNFTVYFPNWNCSNVVKKINSQSYNGLLFTMNNNKGSNHFIV